MKNVLCHGSVITKYGHNGLDLRAACFVPALLGKGFCIFTVSDTTERGAVLQEWHLLSYRRVTLGWSSQVTFQSVAWWVKRISCLWNHLPAVGGIYLELDQAMLHSRGQSLAGWFLLVDCANTPKMRVCSDQIEFFKSSIKLKTLWNRYKNYLSLGTTEVIGSTNVSQAERPWCKHPGHIFPNLHAPVQQFPFRWAGMFTDSFPGWFHWLMGSCSWT